MIEQEKKVAEQVRTASAATILTVPQSLLPEEPLSQQAPTTAT